MMLPSPNIACIDDQQEHLDQIRNAISKLSGAVLSIHYAEGDVSLDCPLKGVRLLFLDLHLIPTLDSGTAMYEAAISAVKSTIDLNNGPYILVIWTKHDDEVDQFLERFRSSTMPMPVATLRLDKNRFLGLDAGQSDAPELLKAEISKILDSTPQVRALLRWEEKTRLAAGSVVDNLMGLVGKEQRVGGDVGGDLARILWSIGEAAVGKPNLSDDIRHSVESGLNTLLTDRVLHSPSIYEDEDDLWRRAVTGPENKAGLSDLERMQLNTYVSITENLTKGDIAGSRGLVSTLPDWMDESEFERYFQGSKVEVKKEFVELRSSMEREQKNLGKLDKAEKQRLREGLNNESKFVLTGFRAACDEAQRKGSLYRVLLGLQVPAGFRRDFGVKSPVANYSTPVFTVDHIDFFVVFNWYYASAMPAWFFEGSRALFRIKEPLISDIISNFHGHGTRIGIFQF